MLSKEEETQDKWDHIFREPGNAVYKNLGEYQEGLAEVINFWKMQGVKTVLDLGCGVGRNSLELRKSRFNVVGIDISHEALTQFNSHFGSRSSIEGNINNLPFENESFDAILAIRTLQHGSLEDIKKGIDEMVRILKPKGSVLVSVCGRYSKGKQRPNLVKTATKIGDNLYIPNYGREKGVVHYIFNKKNIKKLFCDFAIPKIWKDSEDYYCFLAYKK